MNVLRLSRPTIGTSLHAPAASGWLCKEAKGGAAVVASRVIATDSSTHSPTYHIVTYTRHSKALVNLAGADWRTGLWLHYKFKRNKRIPHILAREPNPGVLDSQEMTPFTVLIVSIPSIHSKTSVGNVSVYTRNFRRSASDCFLSWPQGC